MPASPTEGITVVLHQVSDLAAAKAVYTALLGADPAADGEYYVGYDVAGQHIGLIPGGGPEAAGPPVSYWKVADLEAKVAELTAAGATVKEAPHSVGGTRQVASVTDKDGNVLGVMQDG